MKTGILGRVSVLLGAPLLLGGLLFYVPAAQAQPDCEELIEGMMAGDLETFADAFFFGFLDDPELTDWGWSEAEWEKVCKTIGKGCKKLAGDLVDAGTHAGKAIGGVIKFGCKTLEGEDRKDCKAELKEDKSFFKDCLKELEDVLRADCEDEVIDCIEDDD